MLRTILGTFLSTGLLAIFVAPASASDLTIAEQVAKLKIGGKVKVKLSGGDTLIGRMGAATADQFNLEPPNAGQGTVRVVRFTEAQSVKRDGLSRGKKWVIGVAVVWIALAIASSRT
jgi:hypothetical protein